MRPGRTPAAPNGPVGAEAVSAVLVAVRQAADAICDRWSLSLVAAARAGESRFAGFMARTGMASRLVTSRLRELERLGVLVRVPYSRRPLRHAYELTPMGRALFAVLDQMERWERNWPHRRSKSIPLRCAACGKPANAREIGVRTSRAAAPAMPPKQMLRRRSTLSGPEGALATTPLARSFDIFGDKWSIELLICAFLRIRRFNEMRAHTGITANILSDRMTRLEAAGLVQRGEAGYRLTEPGIDLYGVIVAVQDWADDWLPNRTRSPLRLVHRACGQTFHPAAQAPDR